MTFFQQEQTVLGSQRRVSWRETNDIMEEQEQKEENTMTKIRR